MFKISLMILVLSLIILTLTGFSFYLIAQISRNKTRHKSRILELEHVIFKLKEEQKNQSKNLKLSEELKEKLQEARITIDKDIMELQYDLVAIVSKNNLIN